MDSRKEGNHRAREKGCKIMRTIITALVLVVALLGGTATAQEIVPQPKGAARVTTNGYLPTQPDGNCSSCDHCSHGCHGCGHGCGESCWSKLCRWLSYKPCPLPCECKCNCCVRC